MQRKNDRDNPIIIDQFRAGSLRVEDWLKDIFDNGTDRFHVIIPSRCVFSSSHILAAVMKASRAFQRKENKARDRSIEVMRWLSGSRQVSTALEILKIKPPENIFIISIPGDMTGDEPWIEQERIQVSTNLGLDRPEGDLVWGGNDVRSVYSSLKDIVDEELELAVLEMVALTEL